MTRKDYVKLAACIKAMYYLDDHTKGHVASDIAKVLRDDNVRFMPIRFFEACGLPTEVR
jgi:hypothetical protein